MKRTYIRLVAPRSLRAAAAVVCLTDFTAGDAVAVAGVDPTRVRLVPCGVDDPGPGPDPLVQEAVLERHRLPGRPFVLYPAITYAHKNHETLVAAFARLAADHPDARSSSPAARAPSSRSCGPRSRPTGSPTGSSAPVASRRPTSTSSTAEPP